MPQSQTWRHRGRDMVIARFGSDLNVRPNPLAVSEQNKFAFRSFTVRRLRSPGQMPMRSIRCVNSASDWSRPLLVKLRAAFRHDFCPWLDLYVNWVKQPIGWFLIAAAASLLIGATLAPQALVIFAAISAFTLLGVLWPWIEMRGVACRIRFAKGRIREGETLQVHLEIVNRWPWPVRGLAVQRGFFAEAGPDENPTAVALARVPGWSTSVYDWTFRPPRRGVYPAERPVLSSGFPFGIWHARREVEVDGGLIAWPQTVRLEGIPPVAGQDFTVAGMLCQRSGSEGDVLGVRPYRQGDSLRKVHWAQTARHDRLIVCERQATARRTVRVVVDADAAVHRGDLAQGSREWAIRLGATLCQQFHAHDCRVECVLGRLLVADPGPTGIKRLLDEMARFDADESAADAGGHASACERQPEGRPPTNGRQPKGWTPTNGGPREVKLDKALSGSGGALLILVTTDLGLKRLRPDRCVPGVRTVVLQAAGFHESGMEFPPPRERESDLAGAWIRIAGPEQAGADFRRQWERICHDVWCNV